MTQQYRRANRKKHAGNASLRNPPSNPYVRNAKISEYKFRLILRHFAFDRTAREAAMSMRISERTVRDIYWKLRRTLVPAIIAQPQRFGGAGYFLIRDRRLSGTGKAFLDVLAQSSLYRDHVTCHCPRLKSADRRILVLFEVTVRLFCHIAMPNAAGSMQAVLAGDDLLALKTKSSAHRFPGNVLYDHLRQYLGKHPF